MLKHLAPLVVAVVSASLLVGVGAAAANAEDKPLTEKEKQDLKASIKDYKDALTRIKAYRDKIRKETTEGDPQEAHRPLDELNLVLEWLPEFAKNSGVKAKPVEVTKVAQQLQDLFEKVHEKIDAKQKPDYKAVAKDIEAAIKKLEGFSPAQ